jgi:transposase-like protein
VARDELYFEIQMDCPNTGETIGLDIAATEEAFKTLKLENVKVNCPYCGQTHEVDKAKTYLASDPR